MTCHQQSLLLYRSGQVLPEGRLLLRSSALDFAGFAVRGGGQRDTYGKFLQNFSVEWERWRIFFDSERDS
ncbi:MAG TPA: hypothetical protein DEP07_05705 [Brevibacillus sp.]|nr:hypothetical protein [Brevibacillus sp.]